MAQETWGLKLEQELKDKIQEIIKNDFDSSKEFMEQVVSLYELDQLKKGENVLTEEVEELEKLTRRINDIFINANAKINTMLEDKESKGVKQIEQKQRLIERLQADLVKLEEEKENISGINDSLVNSLNESSQEVNQLTHTVNTQEALINEYKEKNDTLTGLVAEYKADHEQVQVLQKESMNLSNKNKELTFELDKLKDTYQEQATKHQESVQATLKAHEVEIQAKDQQAQIKLNTALLEERQKHQKDLQALQDKHNKEIEQYQSKYKELLEQLEQKKKTTTRKKKEEQTV